MNVFIRILQRAIIFIISLGVLWLITTQIFARLDDQLPLFMALVLTYLISAYLILPRVIHFTAFVLRKKGTPRFTLAGDGLPADPINITLIGPKEDLIRAFVKAGWYRADKLTLLSAFKMSKAFIFNRPYPSAPFSSLFLFGRRYDIGFEMPIGKSPRKRHHVRFWESSTEKNHWVGAATKDTGFALAKLTYQLSHAVDPNVDEERTFILSSLQKAGCISNPVFRDIGNFAVGPFISDGRILEAEIKF